ncbi:hypothetical protein BH09BAC5_BH09BAC5_02320 [soil metagenome]
MTDIILLSSKTDPVVYYIIVPVFLIILFFWYYFSKKAVVLRNLERAQSKKIISFSDGEKGKVSGKIVFAGETLTAPLSGRKCSYYHILVEQYRSGGKSGSWHKIIEEEKKGDVVIEDETGFAIVDTRFTMSYLVPDANYKSGSFSDPTPVMESVLRHYNIDPEGLLGFNKTLRYTEGILEKDELCVVSGTGQWNLAKDHNIKIPTEHVLVITTEDSEREKIYISDDPQAMGIEES